VGVLIQFLPFLGLLLPSFRRRFFPDPPLFSLCAREQLEVEVPLVEEMVLSRTPFVHSWKSSISFKVDRGGVGVNSLSSYMLEQRSIFPPPLGRVGDYQWPLVPFLSFASGSLTNALRRTVVANIKAPRTFCRP